MKLLLAVDSTDRCVVDRCSLSREDIRLTLQDTDSSTNPNKNLLIRLFSSDKNGGKVGGKTAMVFLRHMTSNDKIEEWKYYISATMECHNVDSKAELESDQRKVIFLHSVTRWGSCKILETFIDERNVNVVNSDGQTALHIASERGHADDVEFLLDKKMAKIVADRDGYTPLHLAVMTSRPKLKVIDLLVGKMRQDGAQLNAQTKDGANTVLHLAAANVNVTQRIIARLADANPLIVNEDKETAFHVAARFQNPELILSFLRVFVVDNCQYSIGEIDGNREGEKLIEMCARNGNAKAVAMLLQLGADVPADILHTVVIETEKSGDKVADLMEVCRAIADNAVEWKCRKDGSKCPLKWSERYWKAQPEALVEMLDYRLQFVDDFRTLQRVFRTTFKCHSCNYELFKTWKAIEQTHSTLRAFSFHASRTKLANNTKRRATNDSISRLLKELGIKEERPQRVRHSTVISPRVSATDIRKTLSDENTWRDPRSNFLLQLISNPSYLPS